MANRHSVTDNGDLRKYYAAIPNIVLTLGLNPFELALYVHFKQAAGDDGGACWKSRATIARESGMSSGMVTKARQALEIKRPELKGRALITVTEEASKSGGRPTCRVTITDVWALNMSQKPTSPHDIGPLAPSPHDVATSPHDRQRHHTTLATSPHDLKEEPMKKNQEEVRGKLPPPFCGSEFLEALTDFESHRVENKRPLTAAGRKQLYSKLRKADDEAQATQMLCDATINNWKGVWKPKGSENGNGQRFETSSERNIRNLRETSQYVRQLSGEAGSEYPEGPPPLLIGSV